eukprot:gb/GFBE01004141.1/.p1 GENE.gb/GFBE01004141.1/~~gb/GFBE01004141.1/.p1  ORF type:complete len:618 (+),score=71.59 gb/GFBE01004141.1/:1-1854(+)
MTRCCGASTNADREALKESDAELGRTYSRLPEVPDPRHAAVVKNGSSKGCSWPRCPVIDPRTSVFLELWDALMCMVLVAIATITPFEVAFTRGPSLPHRTSYNYAIDAVLLIDTTLQFFTAFPDPDRDLVYVKDPRSIAAAYLSSWLVVDLLSALPLHTLAVMQHVLGPQAARLLRLVRLLRLHGCFQILRRRHAAVGLSYATLSLATFLCYVSVCCHWMGCLWGGVAFQMEDSHTWLDALRAAKGGPAELYETPRSVYSMSLYWAIMTLTSIGYGDITPQTELEYWVSSLCMVIMASTWAYVIGEVCGVVATLMPHDVAFKRTMDDLNWLMQDRRMPTEMRHKLRRYFHESRSLSRLHEQKSIIAQMSPMLQGEVSVQMLGDWMHKVPYLANMDPDVLVNVARKLQPMLYAPNEAVCSERSLFIVRRGICMRGAKILIRDDVWGTDMILSNDHLRDHSQTRCLSYLEVLTLRHVDLSDIVRRFDSERAKLRWCQVRLALMRAFSRMACGVRSLETKQAQSFGTLPEKTRYAVLTSILEGKFTGELPREKPASRRPSFTSPGSADSVVVGSPMNRGSGSVVMMVGDSDIAEMKKSLASLTQALEELQETVLQLPGKH